MTTRPWLVSLAALALFVPPAFAQIASPDDAGFTPRVPVSGLARPSLAIDPSRLHMSTSVSFGTYGRTTSGLQVTSFQYQFRQPLAMSLRLGSTWGGGNRGGFGNGFNRGNALFLEGLDLTYSPSRSFTIHVGYQDVRSPLQRGFQADPYGFHGTTWGR